MSYTSKIFNWMPRHFRDQDYGPHLKMAGEILDELEDQIKKTYDETFISMANEEFLKIHAKERDYNRVSYGPTGSVAQETLVAWANRLRRIKYNRTAANILLNLESVAPIFNAQVKWDYPDGVLTETGDKRSDTLDADYPPANWGNFGPLDLKKRFNCFSVVIEFPVPPPDSFYDDNRFFDDEAFMDDRIRTFDQRTAFAVKQLIGQKVPAGCGWRLLVKNFTGITIGGEDSQERDLNS